MWLPPDPGVKVVVPSMPTTLDWSYSDPTAGRTTRSCSPPSAGSPRCGGGSVRLGSPSAGARGAPPRASELYTFRLRRDVHWSDGVAPSPRRTSSSAGAAPCGPRARRDGGPARGQRRCSRYQEQGASTRGGRTRRSGARGRGARRAHAARRPRPARAATSSPASPTSTCSFPRPSAHLAGKSEEADARLLRPAARRPPAGAGALPRRALGPRRRARAPGPQPALRLPAPAAAGTSARAGGHPAQVRDRPRALRARPGGLRLHRQRRWRSQGRRPDGPAARAAALHLLPRLQHRAPTARPARGAPGHRPGHRSGGADAGLLPAVAPHARAAAARAPRCRDRAEEAARLPHFDPEQARAELAAVPGLDRPLRLVYRAGDSFVPRWPSPSASPRSWPRWACR